jgi:flagellar basal body-associated protein FliL
MKVGKKLWIIIAIKMFLFFVVIKFLFFPNIMEENFSNDQQRAEYILNHLTKGEE